MRYLLLLVLSAFFLMSCGIFKKTSKAGHSLRSTSWTLVSITGFDLEKTEQAPTLIFSDSNTVAGYSGCNNFGAKVNVKKNQITFRSIFSTKRACLPGMQTENQYFTVLNESDGYGFVDGEFVLKKEENIIAVFRKNE